MRRWSAGTDARPRLFLRAAWCALAVCLAGSLLAPRLAWAHAFWLVPFAPAVDPGARVALDLRIGPRWPGESTARLPGLVSNFRVTDAMGVRDIAGRTGGAPVGHFDARVPGAALAAMQTYPSSIVLQGEAFQGYLREEHLEEALRLRAELGLAGAAAREDFSRCAKTLVVVGGNSRGFDRVLGQALELVPLTDPLAHRPGRPFGVRLLAAGQPVAGVRVAALPKFQPEHVVEARTGSDGSVQISLPHGGLWTFYAVRIEPAARPPADWESTWASLTLALPQEMSP
mgnify:CR=1 FL=1